MIQPPAFLLQQQVALKTARRVAIARGASFARFLPATDKIRAKVRAVAPAHSTIWQENKEKEISWEVRAHGEVNED